MCLGWRWCRNVELTILLRISSEAITRDWANREVVEKVRMNIVSLANFLTRFGASGRLVVVVSTLTRLLLADASVRDRLAKMNEKLATMERTLAYVGLL